MGQPLDDGSLMDKQLGQRLDDPDDISAVLWIIVEHDAADNVVIVDEGSADAHGRPGRGLGRAPGREAPHRQRVQGTDQSRVAARDDAC